MVIIKHTFRFTEELLIYSDSVAPIRKFADSDFCSDDPDRAMQSWALGAAFALDAATDYAFQKLSRYETALSRDLERTMRQLAELQQARQVSSTASPSL